MALKIIKKVEKAEKPKLPEGADRFLWSEIPASKIDPKFAEILRGPKRPT